jgi:hypothetical protein
MAPKNSPQIAIGVRVGRVETQTLLYFTGANEFFDESLFRKLIIGENVGKPPQFVKALIDEPLSTRSKPRDANPSGTFVGASDGLRKTQRRFFLLIPTVSWQR